MTKQPHYSCHICDDGKFYRGGYCEAGWHSKHAHPKMQFNVSIEMRWPERQAT